MDPGGAAAAGFAFDNELQGLETEVGDFTVDATVRRWRDLLPWRRSRDWHDVRLWSAAGNAWRLAQAGAHEDDAALDPDAPAEGLSCHEAEAWCRWAGRRLLGEAEWMAAAATPGFVWGELWEWTAEAFAQSHEKYLRLAELNPLFPIFGVWDDALTGHAPSLVQLLVGTLWGVGAFVLGGLFFMSREREFAVRL